MDGLLGRFGYALVLHGRPKLNDVYLGVMVGIFAKASILLVCLASC